MNSSQPSIPFARYASLAGVHTTLLVFAAIFLPQTTYLLVPSGDESKLQQGPIFTSVTADPVLTLAWFCLGGAVLQAWWGGWMRYWWRELEQARSAGFQTVDASQDDVERRIGNNFKDALVATLVSSALFYFVVILFGAPISSHFSESYLLSVFLAILVVFPVTYALRTPSFAPDTPSLVHRLTWTRLFAEISPRTALERALVYPACGAILGAWMGALPIALDWERPWQTWPLTPAFGAIAGYILSTWGALLVSATHLLADADRQAGSSPHRSVLHPTKAKTREKEKKKTK
ncbi:PIG-F-domain-containing protein [Rickenella mellea]|uniref:PIG-F-domain-containing protein n=1 Tax=Rickenella mellea TaxID=50990 RepID=A0A4Y7QM45_9AGAM|nr:PIG-F-domain-containing protein [Rickenella mellea]